LVLSNCAVPMNSSKVLPTDRRHDVLRLTSIPGTDYDGTPLRGIAVGVPRVDIRTSVASALRSPAQDVDGSEDHRSNSLVIRTNAGERTAPRSAPMKYDPRYLDDLAKEDPENRLLESKITICKAC
jgi:hypothetical protein